MSAERLRTHGDALRQLAGTPRFLQQHTDHVAARGVGQCRKSGVELRFGAQRGAGLRTPLGNPPQMPLGIEGSIAAIRPIIFAIVVKCGLLDDSRAARARMSAVCIRIVDEEHDALGAGAVQRLGAAQRALPRALRIGTLLAHHDQPLAIGEFAVFDPAVVALDLEPHLKTEGIA